MLASQEGSLSGLRVGTVKLAFAVGCIVHSSGGGASSALALALIAKSVLTTRIEGVLHVDLSSTLCLLLRALPLALLELRRSQALLCASLRYAGMRVVANGSSWPATLRSFASRFASSAVEPER